MHFLFFLQDIKGELLVSFCLQREKDSGRLILEIDRLRHLSQTEKDTDKRIYTF